MHYRGRPIRSSSGFRSRSGRASVEAAGFAMAYDNSEVVTCEQQDFAALDLFLEVLVSGALEDRKRSVVVDLEPLVSALVRIRHSR